MSAVNLSKLNAQVNTIKLFINEPEAFIEKLEELIYQYSPKKVRLGNEVPMRSLIPSIDLPNSVKIKIEELFSLIAILNPEKSLQIVDLLWSKDNLDSKILAIDLLTRFSPNFEAQISDRIVNWIQSTDDAILQNSILEQIFHYSLTDSLVVRMFIEESLESKDRSLQKFGFRTLSKLISQDEFEDLPWFFNIFQPIITKPTLMNQNSITDVLKILIKKSEVEVASFLIELGKKHKNKTFHKYLRRIMSLFSSRYQKDINQILI